MSVNHAAPGGQRHDPAVITCKGCGGWAPRDRDRRNPPGWYVLSVAIPPGLDTRGRDYAWAGSFCSVRCLAAAIPDLERQEQLAHQAYQPVRPVAS